jgi:hypothetical protein
MGWLGLGDDSMTTPALDLNTPTLAGETVGTGTGAGGLFVDIAAPVTAYIPPHSTVLFAWASGTNNAYMQSVTDAVGNAYQVVTRAEGGRATSIAVCPDTERELRPGDLITANASQTPSGYRLWVWTLPAASDIRTTRQAYATGGTAIELPVMETGEQELIFAVNAVQGNVAINDPSWPMLRQHPNTSPVVRAYAMETDGTDATFTGTLASSGAWSMCAVRLRVFGTEPPPPPEPEPEPPGLVPVVFNGINLNEGVRDDGLTVAVTNLEGWFGTPPLNGADLERALADGAVWGPKTIGGRVLNIEGAVSGPRDLCLMFSRQLAALASLKVPVTLAIGENGTVLTADVRAGTDQMTHEWAGPVLFRYTMPATAADPRLYEDGWRSAILTTGAGIQTGRVYRRTYPWTYGRADIPNSARIVNPGNADAPVYAIYTGPLGESRLTNGVATIRVAPLTDGQQIAVATETLAATAPGGFTRANYIMAGSSPMIAPAYSAEVWRLYATGAGSVELRWKGAYR